MCSCLYTFSPVHFENTLLNQLGFSVYTFLSLWIMYAIDLPSPPPSRWCSPGLTHPKVVSIPAMLPRERTARYGSSRANWAGRGTSTPTWSPSIGKSWRTCLRWAMYSCCSYREGSWPVKFTAGGHVSWAYSMAISGNASELGDVGRSPVIITKSM